MSTENTSSLTGNVGSNSEVDVSLHLESSPKVNPKDGRVTEVSHDPLQKVGEGLSSSLSAQPMQTHTTHVLSPQQIPPPASLSIEQQATDLYKKLDNYFIQENSRQFNGKIITVGSHELFIIKKGDKYMCEGIYRGRGDKRSYSAEGFIIY